MRSRRGSAIADSPYNHGFSVNTGTTMIPALQS